VLSAKQHHRQVFDLNNLFQELTKIPWWISSFGFLEDFLPLPSFASLRFDFSLLSAI
jgi:hypothetical protein